MQNMRHLISTCLLLSISMAASAQNTVEGRVLDKYGNPVSGAKVQGKGMTKYEETAIDGTFVLKAPVPIKRLTVTAIGKAPRICKVRRGQNNITLSDLNWYNEKQDKYRWFVLGQIGLLSSDARDVPLGVMFGRSRKIGWWGKVMFSGLPSTEGEGSIYGYYSGYNDDYYSRTGEIKTGFFSVSAGATTRIYGPLQCYYGAGIAIRKVAYERADDNGNLSYWKEKKRSFEEPVIELGAMVNLKYVTLNIGASLIVPRIMNTIHFGIGYTF